MLFKRSFCWLCVASLNGEPPKLLTEPTDAGEDNLSLGPHRLTLLAWVSGLEASIQGCFHSGMTSERVFLTSVMDHGRDHKTLRMTNRGKCTINKIMYDDLSRIFGIEVEITILMIWIKTEIELDVYFFVLYHFFAFRLYLHHNTIGQTFNCLTLRNFGHNLW